jgi:hypothetical protein
MMDFCIVRGGHGGFRYLVKLLPSIGGKRPLSISAIESIEVLPASFNPPTVKNFWGFSVAKNLIFYSGKQVTSLYN